MPFPHIGLKNVRLFYDIINDYYHYVMHKLPCPTYRKNATCGQRLLHRILKTFRVLKTRLQCHNLKTLSCGLVSVR